MQKVEIKLCWKCSQTQQLQMIGFNRIYIDKKVNYHYFFEILNSYQRITFNASLYIYLPLHTSSSLQPNY